ncbi:hypothetical protein M8818_002727 [Zalaria obscura]|uniref:Uncharacterized protein n=1 Tax=Zalaria obscura TaxID=2024903 RepID=A0ACC3SHJ7_9PEZI
MPSLRKLSVITLGALSVGAAPIAPESPIDSVASDSPVMERRDSASSAAATWNGCTYAVKGVGNFNARLSVDFTKTSSLPSTLHASSNTIGQGTAPYSRQFDPDNLDLESDGLHMIVPGGQDTSPISSAQMTTVWDDIQYGSVRTVAKASSVAGSVHGFFYYYDDSQETDIEIRTADTSQVHFTNQVTTPGNAETTYNFTAPSDITTAFHEYRIDWVAGKTMFYVDGVLKKTVTKNVPSSAGWWMWNNWSNGNTWTLGPPASDNHLVIKKIDAYFNRTSIASCGTK